ncbi:hydrogenase 4 subunit B, partial [mine drainage metagenome]
QGLLAYSTIENNGLILAAVGISLIAAGYGLGALADLALLAGLFMVIAHAAAKSGLFLFAGHLVRSSGSPALNSDRFPRPPAGTFAGGVTVAGLSLAAAPPMAGFVGEWLILETLFQSFRIPSLLYQLLGLLTGALLALAAGLMIVAMTKFVGYGALGRSRADAVHGPARSMGTVVLALGGLAAGLGVAAPWMLDALAPVAGFVSGRSVSAPLGTLLGLPGGWTIVSGAPFGAFTPTAIPIALGLGALVAVGYAALGGPMRPRHSPVWMSG